MRGPAVALRRRPTEIVHQRAPLLWRVRQSTAVVWCTEREEVVATFALLQTAPERRGMLPLAFLGGAFFCWHKNKDGYGERREHLQVWEPTVRLRPIYTALPFRAPTSHVATAGA